MFSDRATLPLPPNLFHDPVVNNGRILPPNGTVVSLAFLDPLKLIGREEVFFPEKIFIRQEMETAFQELVFRGTDTCTIFSGSPGIGKSILLFLVVLYKVSSQNDMAVYIRFVDDAKELVSKFAMRRLEDTDASNIDIRFTRKSSRSGNIAQEYELLRGAFWESHQLEWSDASVLGVVDGPKSSEFTKYSLLTYGCTSGGGIRIKNHMAGFTFNVVMGAWKPDDLRFAVVALLELDPAESNEDSSKWFDQEKFDAVYFVNGGRIRRFISSYQGQVDTSFADETVERISISQAQLSLSHRDCRSTNDHVDSLRSMFRIPGGATDRVSLHVDSGYLLRRLREKITGDEIFNSYKKAEAEGNTGAQSSYFEEMMHWCFSQEDSSPSIVHFVHASGTGAEGVSELESQNVYWIPSVPNFVNIDSAIVGGDGSIWCFQFTVSRKHTYKKRRLRSNFLNLLPNFATGNTTIVFVVPKDTLFSTPDTGNEVETDVAYVDCTSLESVLKSSTDIAKRIAPPETTS